MKIWYNVKKCKGGLSVVKRSELSALAYDEATRLVEEYFSHHHPYTCWMEIPAEVSYAEEEFFCSLVESELRARGEKITRDGKYFKIDKFQRK